MKRGGWLRRLTPLRKRKPFEPKNGPTDRELDALCRAVVFRRDGHQCRRCRAVARLQWAHIYSRRYRVLRWKPDNSLCLCAGCHLWAHHRPLEFAEFVREQLGERADRLSFLLKAQHGIDRQGIEFTLRQELNAEGPGDPHPGPQPPRPSPGPQ